MKKITIISALVSAVVFVLSGCSKDSPSHDHSLGPVMNNYVCGYIRPVKLFLPDDVSNYQTRSFGERIAMNMPLQGSASDIIKMAMIDVANKLKEGGFKAKLVLQVHDELLIDCPENEVEQIKSILKASMENVAKLKVKLEVDLSAGNNWLEAK